ncbi:MAG: cobyric acid synthase [Thaumarchaeota archaeon]|nr:cobyric acid synthase [Nitrososphaerota archaeon]
MVQGTSSGAGKTTLVTALCRIFAGEGFRVAPFKSQNMSAYSYRGDGFEISRAQAIQAIAARADMLPEMNPILLKPLGEYRSEVFVMGRSYKKMHADEYYKKFALGTGLETATKALDTLLSAYDLVILEGAGSPSEVNMQRYDIANMRMARHCSSPVLLVSDIDRGGTFASILGTMELLGRDKSLVAGYVINKFRGDAGILHPGFRFLKRRTGRPVLGTIPLLNLKIPEEDSLHANPRHVTFGRGYLRSLEKEIEQLSRVVRSSLDMKAIGGILK